MNEIEKNEMVQETIELLSGIRTYNIVHEGDLKFEFQIKYDIYKENISNLSRKLKEELNVIFWGFESKRLITNFLTSVSQAGNSQLKGVVNYVSRGGTISKIINITIAL